MEANIPTTFAKFFKAFPTNATKWSQATDEIRDLTRYIREYYNEVVLNSDLEGNDHPSGIKSLNWRNFKTPSEWNTNGQQEIIKIWNKLDKKQQLEFTKEYLKTYFPQWF